MVKERRLGKWNDVGGTGGRWRYALKTRDEIGCLSVVRASDGAELHLTGLSPYRTTALARRMGDGRLGYETEARRAIRDFEAAP